ncbi:MAG: PDZ domain-containing protein [Enterobacterales bacterium]|nr:PDZ domain-containing protein [Enterobacterales bacterium]
MTILLLLLMAKKTNSSGKLRSQISGHAIGHSVKIKLLRNGKVKTLKVKIGSRSGNMSSDRSLHKLLEDVIFEDSREGEGVVVKSMARDSIAAYSGLREGDLIVGANRRRVTSIDEFSRALEQNDSKILLRVVRGRSSFYLVIQ